MPEPTGLKHWTITQAKANLDHVIDMAHATGPQIITKRGVPVAVVVSAPEWQQMEILRRFRAPRGTDSTETEAPRSR